MMGSVGCISGFININGFTRLLKLSLSSSDTTFVDSSPLISVFPAMTCIGTFFYNLCMQVSRGDDENSNSGIILLE